jgi:hypothetical protein
MNTQEQELVDDINWHYTAHLEDSKRFTRLVSDIRDYAQFRTPLSGWAIDEIIKHKKFETLHEFARQIEKAHGIKV